MHMEVVSVQYKHCTKYICVIRKAVSNKIRYSHRITEYFGLEETFKNHLVHPSHTGKDIFH